MSNAPSKPAGGTEILLENLQKYVDISSVNIILTAHSELLSETKPNVLWLHLSYDQENVKGLGNQEFLSKLDAIIFVSHWQYEKFRNLYDLKNVKCAVIQNCVEEFKWIEKPKRIKLIYTSTPWRGLQVLVGALQQIDLKSIDVVVYSGNKIYGPSFAKSTEGHYDELYEQLKQLGVNHIEYAPNEDIRKELQTAHILAYPSIFEETSCLSAIEALSAGCKVVTTSFGALPETCSTWASYVTMEKDLVDRYAKSLQKEIDTYWDNYTERKEQYDYYKKNWSWTARKPQWEKLIGELTMEEQTLTINDKEYKVSDLTQEQVYLINQINNIDQKIGEKTFEIDQLNASRYRFVELLNGTTVQTTKETETNVVGRLPD
jgi:glycosyltransferase involved in cell wall biosynthesis